ncbi:MAG: tRNA dihydrouridine synthase DusB [Syntrophomonadaceae bacterium]|nr:tRNA dihydrouridine synthase DusB [Syntrophomonadaceae bacterium]
MSERGAGNLRIGGLQLAGAVVAAPMAGISDRAFRALAREYGCALTFTEMVSAQALVHGQAKSFQLSEVEGEEGPVAVQLFGADPAVMARAARLVVERGAQLVDINMGCPTPRIVANGEGAALLRDGERARRVVAAVAEAVPVPVTVKMRAGWEAGSTACLELGPALVEAGAQALVLHPRSRDQFFGGRADWSLVARLVQAVKVPVIGNGDVRSAADAARLRAASGCQGVMIGRGSLGDPFLFAQAAAALAGEPLPAPPSARQRLQAARRHLELLGGASGSRLGAEVRRQLGWYLRGFPGAAPVRAALHAARTWGQLEEVLRAAERRAEEVPQTTAG